MRALIMAAIVQPLEPSGEMERIHASPPISEKE